MISKKAFSELNYDEKLDLSCQMSTFTYRVTVYLGNKWLREAENLTGKKTPFLNRHENDAQIAAILRASNKTELLNALDTIPKLHGDCEIVYRHLWTADVISEMIELKNFVEYRYFIPILALRDGLAKEESSSLLTRTKAVLDFWEI